MDTHHYKVHMKSGESFVTDAKYTREDIIWLLGKFLYRDNLPNPIVALEEMK